MLLWWTTKAWPWLKQYWMWVVLPPLALVAYLFGKDHGKVTVVTDDRESDDARDVQSKIDEAQKVAQAEFERKRREEAQRVLVEHAETVSNLTEQQRDDVGDLLEKPDKLNDYLLGVGRKIRGTSG